VEAPVGGLAGALEHLRQQGGLGAERIENCGQEEESIIKEYLDSNWNQLHALIIGRSLTRTLVLSK
jgi:hypothetical protein